MKKIFPKFERIQCAFCHGKGVDPFGVMSPEAVCQVCNGTGERLISKSNKKYAYCHSSGVEFNTSNTCLSCGGVGVIEVKI